MDLENKTYRLIIIGAGIAGLSTALAWLKIHPEDRNQIVVFEKNRIPGGCVTTFAKKGFRFDTTQIIPDVSGLLKFLEVDISMKKFEKIYARIFFADTVSGNVSIIPIPSSAQDFLNQLMNAYPEDKKTIQHFFRYCHAMHNELRYLKTEPKWYQLPRILLKCRKIILNSNRSYHQFLQSFKFKNKEVFRILDIFSSFSGLSGDRCSALLTTSAMVATLKGSFRPDKGFIQFPLALKNKLVTNGGIVKTNSPVSKIIIENNKATGVLLGDGKQIFGENIISTADTKYTFQELVGFDILKKASVKYFNKVNNCKMSASAFTIHLGLDEKLDLKSLGFNCGYNVLSSCPDAHIKIFEAWERNELICSDEIFHLAVICPSLLTGGKQNMIIRVVPVPSKYWIDLRENDYSRYTQEKNTIADFYINKVDQYMVSGLKAHILFRDVSTPATFKRYIGSPTGSQYDMMPVPENFGKNRLKTRTPITGLFVPKFSHGIWPSMQAGLQVVDMITGGKIMHGNSSYRG